MKTTHIIDASSNTTSTIPALKQAGIESVIRYYCSDEYKTKRIDLAEVEALSEAGIRIGIVFQNIQNSTVYFSKEIGYDAGKEAYNYAHNIIQQPFGSIITFAVDFDPSEKEINDFIVPYFKGVKEAFADLSQGNLGYGIGVYGSGLTCNMIWKTGLCSYRWLSQSGAFRGTAEAISHGDYELQQIYIRGAKIGGLSVDYNIVNPNLIGTFIIDSTPTPSGDGIYTVNVRESSFLNLRTAPDVDSNTVTHLKKGQRVYVLDISGQWAYLKVKVQEKLYHGFAFAQYLEKEE